MPLIQFKDEHAPHCQFYKAVWLDDGHICGHGISPMLQKWICEAMEHIYNGAPKPTLEPYIMTLGPREVVAPK